MKKILTFLVTLIIGLLLFGWMLKIAGFGRILEALFLFLSFKGLAILLLSYLIIIVSIERWRLVLKKVTSNLQFKDLGKVWLASFPVTFLLTPISIVGGEPVRAYLGKKFYSLTWKKSFSSVAIDRILDWTLFLIFTGGGIFFFLFYGGLPSKKMSWLGILLVGGLFFLLWFFYFKSLKRESTLAWFLKLFGLKKQKIKTLENKNSLFEIEREVINFISSQKKAFWQGIGLSVLKYLLYFFRVALLIFFLEGETHLLRSFAIYGFNNLALLSPFPATLGSLEVTGLLSFKALGLNLGSGTIFAMVLRGVDLIFSLIGGIFLLKFTLQISREKFLKFIEKLREGKIK